MKVLFRYLNVLTLAVFVWVSIPVSYSHDLFANHHDDDQTECLLHHRHLGVHVEKLSSHCGLFNFESPLYDEPRVVNFSKPAEILLNEICIPALSGYSNDFLLSVSARGPPCLA